MKLDPKGLCPKRLFLMLATAIAVLFPLSPFAGSVAAASSRTVAGMVDASFSVTPNGSATYVVPITVPPGTNGVQPRLTLSYDSQATDGVLGMGFTLHGLSSITRCAATKALDGYVGSISFTAEDRFCLDGRRLILVAGSTYGAPGTVYHTENETWTKITAGPACGSGPCSFTALAKDGTTLEFGTAENSQVPVPGRAEIFAWKIGRTVDLHHNTVEVTYRRDIDDGESYPDTIAYTGNTATGLEPRRSVTFEWESRPDVAAKYVGGFLAEQGLRLAKLVTVVDGATVLEYRFDYETSPGTGRSRLETLHQCAPDPDHVGDFLCLEPTTFTWHEESNTLASPNEDPDGLLVENWCSRASDSLSGWADFDGDGLDDLTCSSASGSQFVLLSTRTGLESPNDDPDGLVRTHWCASSGAVVRWADFDGDGRADLHCDDDDGNHWVLVSDGTDVASPNQDPDGLLVENWCPRSIGRPHWINFDGDGRADLTCAADNGSHYVLISDGTTVASPNDDPDGLVLENWCAANAPATFWGDFNGDGMSDLNCSLSDGSHYVKLSTGTGVTSPNDDPDGLVLENWCAGTSGDRRFATTDLNGDRLFDLTCHTKDGRQYVLLSTGTGVASPNDDPDGLLLENWCGQAESFTAWNDWNGDGLQDLGCSNASSGDQWVLLSTGTGLRAPGDDPDGLLIQGFCPGAGVERFDWNGDALGDLHCPAADGSQYVLVHAPGFPDLIAELENGFGGTTTLSYKPLTDPSVYQPASTSSPYPILDVTNSLYVVSSTTQGDGRGNPYAYGYTYSAAKTDLERRQWLGFATMTMTGAADGRTVTTTYSQVYPQNGFVLGNVARTADGTTLATTSQTPTILSSYPNVHQVVPESKTDVTYENGQAAQTRQVDYAYDDVGNLALTADLGDPATAADDVFTCIRHDNDVNAWQLGYETERQLTTTRAACQSFLDAETTTWDPSASLRWTKLEYDVRRNPKTMKVYDIYPEAESQGTWAVFAREFDDWGNVVSITDPARNVSTLDYETTYRTFLTARHAPELAGDVDLTTAFTYEPHFGLLVSTIDPNGNEKAWREDAFGRVVASLGPPPEGSSRAATELLSTTSFMASGGAVYDETRIRQSWDDADPESWFWSRTYLDGMGRIYKTANRGPSADVDRLQSFQFDAEGRPWKSSYPYYTGDSPAYTVTTYDEHGRISLVTSPDGSKVQTEYDLARSQITTIEGDGTPDARATVSTLDSRGNVLTLEDPSGGVTTTRYNRLSQKTHQANPIGATTTWVYDSLGRVRSASDTDRGDRSYDYDDEGFLRSATDGVGNVAEMVSFDAIGRLLERKVTRAVDGSEVVTTYTYDQPQYTNPLGRLTQVSAPSSLQEFAYDRYGNVSAQSLTLDGERSTEATTYDPAGRLAELTYPDGTVLHQGYDDQGYIESLDLEPAGGGQLQNYTTYGDFDALGQAGTAAFGSGVTSTYAYYPLTQALGRLQAATTTRGASTLSTRTYAWNLFGQVESITAAPDAALSESFTYHPNGWLHIAQGPYPAETFTYDAAGNIKTASGTTYDYPEGSNQLSSTTEGLVLDHDGNGNVDSMTVGGVETSLTYDGSSNLIRIEAGGTVTMEAVYDPDGNRLKRTDADGVVSRYLFATYERVDDDTSTRYTKYVVGPRGPVAAITVEASDPRVARSLRHEGHRVAALLYDAGRPAGLLAQGREHLAALATHPRLAASLGRAATFLLALAGLLLALWAPARRLRHLLRRHRREAEGEMPFTTAYARRHRLFAHATPWVLAALLLTLAPPVHADLGSGSGYPRTGEIYFLLDHVESTILVTDAQGNPQTQVTYEPFGEIDEDHSSGPDDFRPKYTTKELDAGTGLYYFGARYHDPHLGRFLQPDVERQFPSPYAYVGNDPEDGIDPDGNFAFLVTALVIGVGALVGAYFGAAAVNHSYNPTHWNWRSGKTYAGLFAGAAIGAVGATLGAVAAEAGVAVGIAGEIILGAGENAAYTALGGGSAREIGLSALQGAAFGGLMGAGSRALSAGVSKVASKLNARGKLSELGGRINRGARRLFSSGCSSFPAGTLVATENGPVPIEDVQKGDLVWSADLATGELRLNEVTELLCRESDDLYRIDTDGETFRATAEHPIFVEGLGWVPAARLQAGDALVTRDGDALAVQAVEAEPEAAKVFNLVVARDHNYFATEDQSLVHNGKELCPAVPTVRMDKFAQWWDNMPADELETHWNHTDYGKQFQATVKRRLRSPGKMHEWVMVSKAEKARVWQLTYRFFADETRSPTRSVYFKDTATGVTGVHGRTPSGSAHLELAKMIDESSTFEEYKLRLQSWADGTLPGYQYALQGGAAALPSGFQ